MIKYVNVERWNNTYLGISDFMLNIFNSFIGVSMMTSLCALPMTVLCMYVIPPNIEASTFAIIDTILTFQSEWGGHFMGSLYSKIFHITKHNLSNFPKLIVVEMLMILGGLVLAYKLLPTNEEMYTLGKKLNK